MDQVREFLRYYYEVVDENPADMVNLYREYSVLTLEGEKFRGQNGISAKLASLHSQRCWHYIDTIDYQPLYPNRDPNGALVVVTGRIKLAGEPKKRNFRQTFCLAPTPQGSFYVLNDIFRSNHA